MDTFSDIKQRRQRKLIPGCRSLCMFCVVETECRQSLAHMVTHSDDSILSCKMFSWKSVQYTALSNAMCWRVLVIYLHVLCSMLLLSLSSVHQPHTATKD